MTLLPTIRFRLIAAAFAGSLLMLGGWAGSVSAASQPLPAPLPQPGIAQPNAGVAPVPVPVPVPVPEAAPGQPAAAAAPAPGPGQPVPGQPGMVQASSPTGVMEPDKVSLDDVRNKMTVTRDETWVFRDQMQYLDMLKDYNSKLQQLNGIHK